MALTAGGPMQVDTAMRQGCLVLSLAGWLGGRTAPELRDRTLKALADGPRAVILDLSELHTDRTGASAFLLLADLAFDWPETPVVLCCPDPVLDERFHRLRISERLAVRPTLADALADPGRRPGLVQAKLCLPPVPEAPGRARRFLAHVCEVWHADEFVQPGSLALSELVTNAVRHAGTALTIRVVLTGSQLRLSVRDRGGGWPAASAPADRADGGGLGLPIVAAVTDAWGTVPAEGGGKVVWCRLTAPRRPRVRRPGAGARAGHA